MEKRYFHKKGHALWVLLSVTLVCDADNNPLFFFSQVQDITERKRAEEALREIDERFQAFLNNSPSPIFIKDTEGRYVIVNRQLKRQQLVPSRIPPHLFYLEVLLCEAGAQLRILLFPWLSGLRYLC